MRPAWLEIDLSAIEHNLAAVKRLIGPAVGVIGVVKSDAYGHGAEPVARRLVAGGVDMLAVALVQEGIALREAGLTAPILVLGATDADEAPAFIEHDILPAISDLRFARALSAAASDAPAPCHVKIDTGMGRQGVRLDEVESFAAALRELPHLRVEGAFSHFADASADRAFTEAQISNFASAVALLEAGLGRELPLCHLSNSGATLRHPEARLDAVRPGALLYGIAKPGDPEYLPGTLQAMTLKARIVALKDLRRGESVGYGRSFVADRDTRTALLPLGYADGYPRALSNNAEVLLRGRRCPLVGRVSMDCIMADVGDIPDVAVGEEVVLLGRQGEEMITTGELAQRAGTIVQEIVSRMSPRLPKVYLG